MVIILKSSFLIVSSVEIFVLTKVLSHTPGGEKMLHEITGRCLQVSTCKFCKTKYDPVPRDQEWGLAEFACVCGNVFW